MLIEVPARMTTPVYLYTRELSPAFNLSGARIRGKKAASSTLYNSSPIAKGTFSGTHAIALVTINPWLMRTLLSAILFISKTVPSELGSSICLFKLFKPPVISSGRGTVNTLQLLNYDHQD